MAKKICQWQKTMLCGTVAAFAVSSAALLFIPFTAGIRKNHSNVAAYVIAAVFWIGLLTGIVLSVVTAAVMRKHKQNHMATKYRDHIPGAFRFQTKPAFVAMYAVIIVGILLMISDIFFNFMPQTMMLPVVSATVFTFELHCVLDGKNYWMYKKSKESEKNEKKRKR